MTSKTFDEALAAGEVVELIDCPECRGSVVRPVQHLFGGITCVAPMFCRHCGALISPAQGRLSE
jgi:hypothetical protein